MNKKQYVGINFFGMTSPFSSGACFCALMRQDIWIVKPILAHLVHQSGWFKVQLIVPFRQGVFLLHIVVELSDGTHLVIPWCQEEFASVSPCTASDACGFRWKLFFMRRVSPFLVDFTYNVFLLATFSLPCYIHGADNSIA